MQLNFVPVRDNQIEKDTTVFVEAMKIRENVPQCSTRIASFNLCYCKNIITFLNSCALFIFMYVCSSILHCRNRILYLQVMQFVMVAV